LNVLNSAEVCGRILARPYVWIFRTVFNFVAKGFATKTFDAEIIDFFISKLILLILVLLCVSADLAALRSNVLLAAAPPHVTAIFRLMNFTAPIIIGVFSIFTVASVAGSYSLLHFALVGYQLCMLGPQPLILHALLTSFGIERANLVIFDIHNEAEISDDFV
jgi:hypothetical protein